MTSRRQLLRSLIAIPALITVSTAPAAAPSTESGRYYHLVQRGHEWHIADPASKTVFLKVPKQ